VPNYAAYNEQEILRKVADGDEHAFSELFYHWLPFLSTHIFRITESRELTEEIVQDVFLKIWMSRETLTDINNFKGYLIIVSRNHALNFLRKRSREEMQFTVWKQELNNTDDENNWQSHLTLIDEAIDQLSQRQKEIYLLHRHERLTYEEIGNRLSIGRETVKSHLKLAVSAISGYVRSHLSLFFFF
jgi:RNA polymerase sigma factor (sigma-70 family)